jgi:hypothetical protein
MMLSMDFPTRSLLALDRIDAAIAEASAASNKLLCHNLRYNRAMMAERIARTLLDFGTEWPDDNSEDSYDTQGRYVVPFYDVTGYPSKAGKPIAEKWMLERNIAWDGSIRSLRSEVVKALIAGERVPKFGLSVKLTCRVRKR